MGDGARAEARDDATMALDKDSSSMPLTDRSKVLVLLLLRDTVDSDAMLGFIRGLGAPVVSGRTP